MTKHIITLLLVSAVSLQSATYYVTTSGNDSNPGSEAQPWRMVQKAVNTAVADDIVNIGSGIYAEDVTCSNSGTSGHVITINGPGRIRRVVVNGSYITFSGVYFGSSGLSLGALKINGSYVTVQNGTINQMWLPYQSGLELIGNFNVVSNCAITGVNYFGAVTTHGHDNLVVACRLHDMDNADVFRIWGYNNVFRGNEATNIYNSDYNGFHCDAMQTFAWDNNVVSSNNIIEGNLFHKSYIQCMQINSKNERGLSSPYIGWWHVRNNIFANVPMSGFLEAQNVKVYNNVFYKTATNSFQEAALWIWASGLHGSTYGGGEGSQIYNNVFIGCGANDHPNYGWPKIETGSADYNFASTASWGAKTIVNYEPNALTGFNPQFVDAAGLNFQLLASSGLIDKGVTIAGTHTDRAGVSRPQGAAWDIGAFEYTTGGGGGPGTIALETDAYNVSQAVGLAGGAVTITVTRSSETTGAVGITYNVNDGTALAGTDYTDTTGTLSWADGDGASKTFTVTILARTAATRAFTVVLSSPTGGATLGAQSTATVTITGGTIPLMPGLSFEAEDGLIEQPYSVAGGAISQQVQTTTPTDGGRARYRFTAPAPGDYSVTVSVDAATTASDSFFIDIDGEPVAPTAIFDIPTTSGFQTKTVSWRGSSTPPASEFNPKIWTLAAGEHTLYARGREPGCQINNFTINQIQPVSVLIVGVTAGSSAQYYKASQTVPILLTCSSAITVTGTPRILLNNGAYANYASGSGGTELTFNYVVGADEDIAALDYASTNALELNSGTMKNGGTDLDRTLAVPGQAGSLAASKLITIDTIAPTVTIGSVSPTLSHGEDILIPVTFADVNPISIAFTGDDATLEATMTATAAISVTGSDNIRTVRLSGVTGEGTLKVYVLSGRATDAAGNQSASAGPSGAATVTQLPVTTLKVRGSIRANQVRH